MAKAYNNFNDLITFTRASSGTALRPISYGNELVTNGTFDDGTTGWTGVVASLANVSDQLQITNLSAGGRATQTISTIAGNVYFITVDLVSATANSFAGLYAAGTTTLVASIMSGTTTGGTYTLVFAETVSRNLDITFRSNDASAVHVWDNISAREVLFDQPDGTLTLFNHPTNIPRIEYDAAGNRLGLLVEESRTNLVTYSDLSSGWTEIDSSISSSSVVAPDGNSTMPLLTATTGSGGHEAYFSHSSSSGTYTLTCYAKAGTSDYMFLSITDTATGQAEQRFNLSTGTVDSVNVNFVGSWTGISGTIIHVGNGIYRCSLTATQGAGTTIRARVVIGGSSGTRTYTPNGESIYAWGAQLEVGSFPTSLIPTSGSTATRSADVASIATSQFGYNQSAGTVVVEFKANDTSANRRFVSIDNGGSSDRIDTIITAANELNVYIVDGGVIQANFSTSSAYVDDTFAKGSYGYQKDNFAVSLNGLSVVTDSAGTVPNANILRIGTSSVGGNPMCGYFKSIKYYPRRLTNAQLQELTS